MRRWMLVIALGSWASTTARADDSATPPSADPTLVDIEVDPFPFATLGYGVQIGLRHPALKGVRISVASFMVNVPDVITEANGNDGFELRVRPSPATYILYYLNAAGRDGFAIGGAVRYLRLRFRHVDAPGEEAFVSELSPEAIVAYQWHPFDNGFYVQPWIGLSVTLHRSGAAVVGAREYDPLPIQPFFTVNVGWEHRL